MGAIVASLLKSLLPYIARYEKQIAELFNAHPDSFLFRDLPGAGTALGPRLLTAFGADRISRPLSVIVFRSRTRTRTRSLTVVGKRQLALGKR